MSAAPEPAPPREIRSHPTAQATLDELAEVALDNLVIARHADTDDEMAARALVSIGASQLLNAQINAHALANDERQLAIGRTRLERLDHVDAMQRALLEQLAQFGQQNDQHHAEALRRFAPPAGVAHELRATISELLLEHQVEGKDGLLEDLLEAIGIEPPPAPLELAASGRCTVCGCTEDRACAGGCSWENAERTLCTRCASAERRGHPRGADPIADAIADLPPPTPRVTP